MQSCTAHSPPQARPVRGGAYSSRCRLAAAQLRSRPQCASVRSDRRRRSLCRAEQPEPEQGDQQQEPSPGGPKFLFDEDPAPPSGEGGGLGGNSQFASVFKAALSRQSMSVEQPAPPPPPPQQQPAEPPGEQAADQAAGPAAEQPVDFGGPKFLFDDLPDPPAAGDGAAGPELLGANPAFANVFKASLARQRSMTDSSGAGSSADSSGDEAAAAPPPAVPQAPQQQPRDRPDAPPRPAPVDPDRRVSAAEEVLHSALRDSRRNIIGLQRIQKDIEDAMKREEQQFDRLHFALQKARSDAARMGVLQAMLDSRK